MALAALHVSLTVTVPRTFGTAAWQVPSALAAGMAEQAMTGLVVSLTVNEVEQESLLPAASVAVTVMVWTPRPTSVPAAGDWIKVTATGPPQALLTLTPPNTLGTAAWQFPSPPALGTAEQITLGAPASTLNVVVLVMVPATLVHCPLTTTWTEWSPAVIPAVATVRLGPFVPRLLPSSRHS